MGGVCEVRGALKHDIFEIQWKNTMAWLVPDQMYTASMANRHILTLKYKPNAAFWCMYDKHKLSLRQTTRDLTKALAGEAPVSIQKALLPSRKLRFFLYQPHLLF